MFVCLFLDKRCWVSFVLVLFFLFVVFFGIFVLVCLIKCPCLILLVWLFFVCVFFMSMCLFVHKFGGFVCVLCWVLLHLFGFCLVFLLSSS